MKNNTPYYKLLRVLRFKISGIHPNEKWLKTSLSFGLLLSFLDTGRDVFVHSYVFIYLRGF